jgi:serine/threonine protein kinase
VTGPGAVLSERFEVERRAGAGGMATVFRAHDRLTGEPVAIKVLLGRDDDSERFGREVRLLAELRHPAIVRYIAHGPTPTGDVYLAMEWLDGETLEQRIYGSGGTGRAGLGVGEALTLLRRIAEALAYAHARGVVHRDIKPSNLYLPDGDLERVKLLDFGVARVTQASRGMTRTGMMLGTPGYMAPEQRAAVTRSTRAPTSSRSAA